MVDINQQISALEAQRDADIDSIYDEMGRRVLEQVEHKQQQCRLLVEQLKVQYHVNENKAEV